MKALFSILFFAALTAQAQLTDNQQIGAGTMYQQTYGNNTKIVPNGIIGDNVFRKIDGKIYKMAESGQTIYGEVRDVDNGKVIVERTLEYNSYGVTKSDNIALENYPKEPIAQSRVDTVAVRRGTYKWNDELLELWDCGIPLTPQEEQQQINENYTARVAQQEIIDEAARQKKEATRQKNFLIQSNAIVHILSYATNGEVWAQTSLGEHYLVGLGCETNKTLAIYWLQKAAEQGDSEASNRLAKINLVSTNAVVESESN